jgi:hypothetical protein
MKQPKSKTYHTDKVVALNGQFINVIQRHVKRYGDPHIHLDEDGEASFEFEHNRFVYCLQETCFLDNMNQAHEYEKLNTEQLAILADYVSNL